ncbi:hypothetical protein NLJ89_g257 [Agrocybe chaxingu]|uniref:Aminoglycoside phosphotransferase domain-containing protein n=1 Tax=Agrocybe chaxingu TaxID=84603 RepID=A0A9W8N2J5_9AGAR|nr:hypothetical protein NLJ89_g257 [Agrocybe chaxingu]
MDYIPGETLARAWKRITPEQRRTVMRILGGYVRQLRTIRQPPMPPRLGQSGWVGSANGNKGYDMRITPSKTWGPFRNEREYNDWRISTFSLFGDTSEKVGLRLRQIREEMLDDHRICFTHGDINRRNVLVRVDGEGPEDIAVVGLLDWEQAGWRPEYWEKAKLFYVTGSTRNGVPCLEKRSNPATRMNYGERMSCP